jgi:hypothetical protein
MAYVLLCAMRRIGLQHTPFAKASCGTIRLKLLKIGALVPMHPGNFGQRLGTAHDANGDAKSTNNKEKPTRGHAPGQDPVDAMRLVEHLDHALALHFESNNRPRSSLLSMTTNLFPSRRLRVEFNPGRGTLPCSGNDDVNRLKTECYNECFHRDFYSHISHLRNRSCLAACARFAGAGRAAQHLHVSVVDSAGSGSRPCHLGWHAAQWLTDLVEAVDGAKALSYLALGC